MNIDLKKENFLKELREIKKIIEFLERQGISEFQETNGRGATYRAAARASITNLSTTLENAKEENTFGSTYLKSIEGLTSMSLEMKDDYLLTNVSTLWKTITKILPNLIHDITSMIEG
jgi:uncharacterized protein with HEPN domain